MVTHTTRPVTTPLNDTFNIYHRSNFDKSNIDFENYHNEEEMLNQNNLSYAYPRHRKKGS